MLNIIRFLLCFGAFCLIVSLALFWQRHNPNRLAFELNKSPVSLIESGSVNPLPSEIIISDLSISLPILPAKIENNKWQSTNKGVSYLLSSAVPGEKGNSILYGHNWSNLLGKITKLKPNQIITVRFADNSSKTFKITTVQEVSPKGISVLANSIDSQLTLYTCSGFLDSKRFVVSAKLVEI